MGKSIWPAHRRDSCHLEGPSEARVECLVVGNEVVVVSSASSRRDLVEDLEVELERRGSGSGIGVERSPCRRTSRCSGRGPVNSRSVFSEPGPRGSIDDRRTPRGPGSATIDHHLTAHAAERQGVRRATNPDRSSDLDESVRSRKVHSRSANFGATIAALAKVRRRRAGEEDSQKSVSVAVEQAVAA